MVEILTSDFDGFETGTYTHCNRKYELCKKRGYYLSYRYSLIFRKRGRNMQSAECSKILAQINTLAIKIGNMERKLLSIKSFIDMHLYRMPGTVEWMSRELTQITAELKTGRRLFNRVTTVNFNTLLKNNAVSESVVTEEKEDEDEEETW